MCFSIPIIGSFVVQYASIMCIDGILFSVVPWKSLDKTGF